jgi:MFS family permease
MHQGALFHQNSIFRALWLARTISFFGDTIATTALVVYAYQVTNSGTAVGFVLLAQALPRLFGPVAGSFVDRVDQRRLMIACELGQTILFALLALLLPSLPLLVVFVTVASFLTTLFAPAGRSVLPTLVHHDDVPTANALLSFGINASLALGPVLGGVCITFIGVRGALLVNTLSFLISALLLQRLPALPPVSASDATATSLLAATRSGMIYLGQHATARAVAIGLFLVVVFGALDNVALVALAQDVFNTDARGYGFISSVYGVGMVFGSVALLRWMSVSNPAYVLMIGIALLGSGGLLTGLAPSFAFAVIAQSAAGIGNGLENIGNDTLIQQTVPRAMLGRVFGIVYSGAFIASSVAYAVGGFLLDRTSPRIVFIIAGVGVLFACRIVWLILPRHQEERHRIA